MLTERFWSKVLVGGVDDCWLWQAGTNGVGYGMFRPGGTAEKQLAHRLSYEAAHGAIPSGLHCLHRCDTPACVNPAHLFLGTNADNIADRIRKGRSHGPLPLLRGDNNWTRRHPERVPRGEAVGTAVLTETQVRSILSRRVAGQLPASIARDLCLSVTAVKNVLSGNKWRHVFSEYAGPLKKAVRPVKRSLSAADARVIRGRLADGETGRSLAAEFGISPQTISEIRLRKIWRDA